MAEVKPPNNSIWVFFFILLLVIIGFGTSVVRFYPPVDQDGTELPPSGCVNSQPIYTTGPRLQGEFTVNVQDFAPRGYSEAKEFSAYLRRHRINNYVFKSSKTNRWVVAVGRFTTLQQAESMRNLLKRKGYDDAKVHTPLDDLPVVVRPQPICGCYAPPPP